MKIDEFEFRNKQGEEIEPTKDQLVIYIKSLHKEIKTLNKALELACEKCLSFPCSDYCSSNDDCEDCYYKREFTPENFKTKAKEMMKSE